MPDPLTLFTLGRTALELGRFAFPSKLTRFEDTEEAKRLRLQQRQGKFSPSVRGKILGRVGARLGGQAGKAKSDIRGRLANQNINRSIAGQRLLAQPDIETQRGLGTATRELEIQNELSKIEAGERYGSLAEASRVRGEDIGRQRVGQFVGGLSNIANIALQYKLNERQAKAYKEYRNTILETRDPDAIFKSKLKAMQEMIDLFDIENRGGK